MNSFKSESRLRSELSMRTKSEPTRRAKRERREWFEDAPVASSSAQELSVWEIDHELYQEASNELYQEASRGVARDEIKEEDFKPTKKRLARILEDYYRSRDAKKSTVAQQIQGFEKSTNDSFKCGLCGYEAEIEEQIYAHWNFGCDAFKVEKRRGLPEAYQCSGCGVRMESKSLIEKHMNFECQGFQEVPLKMKNLNAY